MSSFPATTHWLVRYALAVVMFASVLGLSYLLRFIDFRLNLTIPIIFALVATAWYGGLGPGLLISILFQGTTILYAERWPDPNVAKSIFTWGSVFSLYVFIAFVISRLKQTQGELRDRGDLLQVTLASIGDGVITTSPDGRIDYLNSVAEQMTGWTNEEAAGRPLREVFNIMNETSREPAADPVSKVLETGSVVGLANHTILISRDGREIPIDDSAAPILDNGRIRGVVLVFSDVSERKLVERAVREKEMMRNVIAAQEAERHRIARDLHDHLGQKMTALRLRMESLVQAVGSDPLILKAAGDVRSAALEVDRDIDYLSWELRPTELEHLGLSDALASFVREWSRQYGITAEFHGLPEDVEASTRLPEAMETNLYRIAQEGLHNVLKHSNADRVSVLLQRRRGEIILIIEDNGKGFEDIHTTPTVNGGSNGRRFGGLGLRGMQERAAVLHGCLEIDSRPGEGTTIMAKIPANFPGSHQATNE